jgi:hypothetical protein
MHRHRHLRAHEAQTGSTGATTATQAAVASGDEDHSAQPVPAEDIRLCAYRKWEGAGKPTGDGIQFWLEAEQELVHGK